MGSNPFDYNYPTPVSDLHNQSVRITFNIKNHPVISQKIGRFISPFNILGCLPGFPPDFIAPSVQLASNISVLTLELFEQW